MSDSDTQAALDAGQLLAGNDDLLPDASLKSVLLPAGATHVTIDLEPFGKYPRRHKGTTTVYDTASFRTLYESLVNPGPDHGRVYADVRAFKLVAILNGATADAPGWADHRIALGFFLTPAWQRWAGKDGVLMAQNEFAEHIEASLPEIVEPDGASMLEIASSIQATTSAAFKSSTRLSNGEQQFSYVEEIGGTAGRNGDMTIPTTITLGLQPFEGSPAYNVIARLRYRLDGGHLRIGYKLDRPDEVLRAAFTEIVAAVEEACGLTALKGAVPGS